LRENPEILKGEMKPNYDRCVAISTQASIKEMIPPGILVKFKI
jgi:Na+/H+-translocating membrane pyrophosphatase